MRKKMPRAPYSTLLRRFIAYNLFFVLLPTALLVGMYTRNAHEYLIEDVLASRKYALEQTMEKIDEDMRVFGQIAVQLLGDPRVSPYALRNGGYDTVEAIDQLKHYAGQASFLSELYIYLAGDSNLYASRGIYSIATFTPGTYALSGMWGRESLLEQLESGGEYGLPPVGSALIKAGRRRYVSICYPWRVNQSVRIGSILGVVEESYFTGQLEASVSGSFVTAFLFDADGALRWQRGDACPLDAPEAEEIARSGLVETNLKGVGACSVITLTSQVNGWTYMTVIPRAQFGARLMAAQKSSFLFALILTALCVVIGVLFAYRAYAPIYALYHRYADENGAGERKNELVALDELIRGMRDTHALMQRQLDEKGALEAQRHLQDIIAGNLPDEKARAEARALGLTAPNFFILALLPARTLTVSERETLMENIARAPGCAAMPIEMLYKDAVAVLVNLDGDGIEAAACAIRAVAASAYGREPRTGVGRVCRDAAKAHNSLAEALIALERAEAGAMLYYDKISSYQRGDMVGLLQSRQLRLAEWLRQRNKALAHETARELLQDASAGLAGGDAAASRYVLDVLVFCLMSAAQDAHVPELNDKIAGLLSAPAETLEGNVLAMCDEIIAGVSACEKRTQMNQYEQILRFLRENYTRSDISLTGIAEKFDMTPSYLSRFFRDNAGVNFIDYLTDLRMTEAKRLLTECPDLRVKDVVARVGYVDIASFTRKFRQIEGVSPGKFRED